MAGNSKWRSVNARPRRDDGLMVVPVAAGMSNIEVRYAATRDVWTGASFRCWRLSYG